MRIGELAKLSGLTASRIRFYEAEGLITAVERSTNGYRDYSDDAVWMLEIISGAQKAGFSLEQIRHLLPVGAGNWQHEGLVEALERKVAEIDAMQKRLKENKAQLLVAIDSIRNRPTDLNCAERTRWVMDRLRDRGVVPTGGNGRRSHSRDE
ncbi:MerR family transcriptional regulator [Burkholderia sp. 4701]|nr:MerR family transcriptional regulator [Burkholderia sp. 4701]MXN84619.1 MerR family transcriptional regulator [Burkholderia sp. 4812]